MYKRLRLGDVLTRAGLIDAATLERMLEKGKAQKLKLGEILVKEGILEEETILRAIAEIVGVPFVKLKNYVVDKEAAKSLPEAICRKYHVIPITRERDTLVVSMTDPFDLELIDDLAKSSGLQVSPVVSTRDGISATLDQVFAKETEPKEGCPQLQLLDKHGAPLELTEEAGRPTTIDQLLERLICMAVQEDAQALILEPHHSYLMVKFRIDGMLFDWTHLPIHQHAQLINKLKTLSSREQLQVATPVDESFMVRMVMGQERFELRVGLLETVLGIKAMVHIGRRQMYIRKLDEMGFSEPDLGAVKRIIESPSGLVMVTGPSRSGKTATAYSILNYLQKKLNRYVVSYEAPISMLVEHFNQVQPTKEDFENADATVLRILRQDPDVLLIDRLSNMDSVAQALFAASVGRLAICTYYADTALDALLHLLENPAFDRYSFATQTRGIICQRLIRRICSETSTSYTPDIEELKRLHMEQYKDYTFYKGVGSPINLGTGYRGQTAIYQVLPFTPALTELILNRAPREEIVREAIRAGCHSLRSQGRQKVLSGETTIDEVLRVTFEEERFYQEKPSDA